MAVSATVTPGTILTEGEAVTISKLNALGTPTVDISGAVGTLSLSDGSVTNAKIATGAAIQYDKLATLSTGQVLVGNAGTPTAATLSGDATIDASGALTIAAGAVEEAMLASGVNTVPTGCISMWYTGTAPTGWLICDGSTFDASTYADLDTLLGGNTLPNLKGRVPVGVDSTQTEFETLGDTGGYKTHELTIAEMPAHNHGIRESAPGSTTGVNDFSVADGATSSPNIEDNAIQNTGEGGAHNNLQPYIAINFIIKT
tara:strand:+ start:485 stop:1258 length:774 start_codon:yes stop_codon:yes gene_type:complete